ncbi:dual specificity protein phosphatase [Trypanosoma theileri]|uniref:Dual specificity protein phosphatase n=1 Tax=Trypanosoma theileri TaxID=67003 RepID=A0A1X0P9Q1_9TRYP|nr:dual specificity protein phosphatase [Trypanosoma theileri]ORC93608.1 dual specificity protein phosphatase [Trypanosoma theileri]
MGVCVSIGNNNTCVARNAQKPLPVEEVTKSVKERKKLKSHEDVPPQFPWLLRTRSPGREPSRLLVNAWEELSRTEYASLFFAHPELLFSNRAAVLCTGEFISGETVGKYRVVGALPTGTIGRSFLVSRSISKEDGEGDKGLRKTGLSLKTRGNDSQYYVFKVVTFVTRMELVEDVLKDIKTLSRLNHENILRCVDILEDGKHENLITVTPYLEKGACESAIEGSVNEETFISTLYSIGVGLRVLHSHNMYHHNLKPDNILINQNGSPCISDAGFWRIFAAQTPEQLVFNGEPACFPPEVFETDKAFNDPAKVDIWGFGILMYRLAYGRNPFDVEGKTFEEVRDIVLHQTITFPTSDWLPSSFKEIIQTCLNRDPAKRPKITRLLCHSFFRTRLGTGFCNRSGILGNSLLTGMSLGLSSTTLSMSTAGSPGIRTQLRNGLRICVSLGKGRVCETFLAHLRRNPSDEFVVKAMRHSVLKKIKKHEEEKMHRVLALSRDISHPNILPLLEIVDGPYGCFATQKYVECEFLHKNFPPLTNRDDPSRTVKSMLVDVLKGLHVLHANNISHNGLTPSNIFYCHSGKFVIADFGPLFFTNEDALHGGEVGVPLYNLPPNIMEDLISPYGESKNYLDIFCVGLLAASALPSVLNEVWDTFLMRNTKLLVVNELIESVTNASDTLTSPLVDFIITALLCNCDVSQLLHHPYLVNTVDGSDLKDIEPFQLPPSALKDAVHKDLHCHDEARLIDVLGQDPTFEGNFLTSVILFESEGDDDDDDNDSECTTFSSKDSDSYLRFSFEDQIQCGLCNVELPIVVYMCNTCEAYIRCGKCALNDVHAKNHKMRPLLIHTIEHNKDEKKECILVSPASIAITQPLEELERQANLPKGALTELPEVEKATIERSAWRVKTPMLKKCQKKVLPKAAEVEDCTWEEEIENCRKNRSSELLLYRFDLTSVPKEVFDPPLLHVVSVDLSYNKLKSIPHELSFLPHIRSLIIASNELEELPDSLADLNELEHLDVSHNHLRELPPSFVYLVSLTTIAMDYNDFSEIPTCLTDLVTSGTKIPLLSVIYMAENPRIVQFPDPDALACFPTLKLALDNEPTVYETYIREKLDKKIPNVNMMWNKIYPDRIVENLYCGSLRTAQSQVVYNKLSIKNLLTVGRDLMPVPPVGGRHLTINVDDIEGADIRTTFEEASLFIDESLQRGEGCLVHCFAGMSRSATTVIAYLMLHQHMRLDEAYCVTRRGRPAIYPNNGFFNQLVKMDATLFQNQRPLDMASMERDKIPMG